MLSVQLYFWDVDAAHYQLSREGSFLCRILMYLFIHSFIYFEFILNIKIKTVTLRQTLGYFYTYHCMGALHRPVWWLWLLAVRLVQLLNQKSKGLSCSSAQLECTQFFCKNHKMFILTSLAAHCNIKIPLAKYLNNEFQTVISDWLLS